MKIEEGNANKTIRIDKRFSVIIVVTLVIFMINGSTATMSYAAPQTLPSCTDPTGQNLRCMMVISTLPPPPNALQCQETSGQILPCSYTTQNLSNGEQIVAITVYVPADYVFSTPTVVKVVVRETTSKSTIIKTRKVFEPCPPGQKLNPETRKCVDVPVCQKDQHLVFVGKFICFPIRPPLCNGPHMLNVLVPCPPPPPPPSGYTCDSKYYTGPCPPTDENAYTKCISAALAAGDDKNGLACARLLPDTPENAYTKCISEALFNDDTIAGLKCARLLPPVNSAASNLTNTTTATTPTPSNTSAAIPPNYTSTATSGGKGSWTCAAGNCTSGTPPPVDCTKNPNDPSCTQTLTPPPTTTKTCPDGSVIDASATCPIPSAIPNTTPPPSSSTPPPPSNNPSPPSDNGNPSGGSGSSNGGGSSGGGSSPPQPSTLS